MPSHRNRLLGLLPAQARQQLLDACEPVDLRRAEVLGEAREPQPSVHFPCSGLVSLVMAVDGRPALEVAMVGNEGMLGAELLLAPLAVPWQSLVLVAGRAWCMPAARFQRIVADSPVLRAVVHQYLAVRVDQVAVAVTCQRFHAIGPRMARWLLMVHDRAHRDTFQVTHEDLAHLLGVRRVGVTVAASDFQRRGLIRYHRGVLTVIDRGALQAEACSCYAINRTGYAAMLAAPREPATGAGGR